jgi:uncharacterized protein YbjT (DUF2867 family)
MKIAVLGATALTGRLVVEQALMRGDQVVAYVRNHHGIATNPGLEIAVGQLGDMLALKPPSTAATQCLSASALAGRG